MDYIEGQAVQHHGQGYVALEDHTASLTNEPGVGEDWRDFWDLQEWHDSAGDAIISTWVEVATIAGLSLITALDAMDGHQAGTVVATSVITRVDNILHTEQAIAAGIATVTGDEAYEPFGE